MGSMGPTELIIITVIIGFALLPVASWVYLYRPGGETRDMLFWAVIVLLLPVLGPIGVFQFYRPRSKEKRE